MKIMKSKLLIILFIPAISALFLSCSKKEDKTPGNYRVTRITDANGVTNYEYDANGRVKKANNTEYYYNSEGNIVKVLDENGYVEDYSYNTDGSIKEILITTAASTRKTIFDAVMIGSHVKINEAQIYDKSNNTFQLTETIRNTHNNQNQIIQQLVLSPSGETRTLSYTFDNAGNVISGKYYATDDQDNEYLETEINVAYGNGKSLEFVKPGNFNTKFWLISNNNFQTQMDYKVYNADGTVRAEQSTRNYGEFNEVGYPTKIINGTSTPIIIDYERF